MARPTTLTRRRLLEGMSASGLATIAGAMPFLAKVPSAFAQARPTNFLLCTVPNSWGQSAFWDMGLPSGTDLTLRPEKLRPKALPGGHPSDRWILQPLEPHLSDVTLVGGIKGWYAGKVGPHGCAKLFLTGTGVNQYGSDPWEFHALGPSIDQYIAQRLKVDPINYRGGFITYAAANEPAGSFGNAYGIIKRFFGGGGTQAPSQAFPVLERLLAPVFSDINREMTVLPREDRQALDRYLSELKDLQLRQQQRSATPTSCKASGVVENVDINALRRGVPRATAGYKDLQLATDLVVRAFACNLTRVAHLSAPSEDEQAYFHLPPEFRTGDLRIIQRDCDTDCAVPNGEHHMDHNPTKWVSIRVDTELFYVRWFAGVLKQLKETLGTDGRPLLDSTLVVFARDQALANHKQEPHLLIFAGGAGGALDRGKYYDCRGEWWNRAHITSCHMMGLRDVKQFGLADRGSEPLAMLRS